ncbi:gamma-glutamyl peptidase 5 [Canna indica]|uniref:Gamma-glutamyl peptidase 5 n=1 Tax=Canna indica TaxID=4628 RepID=A0AAQ3KE30_9LILI|nr:gamma-glutamyl peptidase 5 [Canna indica]
MVEEEGGEVAVAPTAPPAAEKKEVVRGRFAVLLCADASKYVKKVHGGYLKVFLELLGEEGETWHVYRAAHSELPSVADIDGYDGFVITGSCNDAHGDDQWIMDLVAFLKVLDSKKKKVLGVCFGNQILSRALGGKTGRSKKGWDIGVTCVHPSQTITDLLSSLNIPSHLPVIEFHQDEVWQLPPHAEVLACSEKTGVEMFRYGDHIMGIQGHPEYDKDILLHLIDRCLQRNLIETSHAEVAKGRINELEPNREAWRRLCQGFLKGKLSW